MNAKFKYLLIAFALLLPSLANAQALIRREMIEALLGSPITYANLPASPRTGDTYWVSDVNAGCTAGGSTNNVVVGWSGSAWICLGSVGAGGGISGLTTNKIPKAASATTIADSNLSDDGTNINMALPPKIGDCTTNCLTQSAAAITGSKSQAYINADGNYALTTGTLTTGNHGKFDSSGRIVDSGLSDTLLRTRTITFLIGSDSGSALADTDDQADIWYNDLGALHITQVRCSSDAGSPIINLQRDDGSAANILSSNLTCATGRAGATSTSFTSGEDAISVGHAINFVLVTAGGSAKRLTITVKATLD